MKVLFGLTFLAVLVMASASFAGDAYENHLIALMLDAERLSASTLSGYSMDASVCYDEFGCFNKFPLGMFPEPPKFINPKFRLYTPSAEKPVKVYTYDSNVGGEDEETKKSLRDPSKKLVFVSHGFGGDGDLKWLQDIKNIRTKVYGENVIAVDWSRGARASTLYLGAAANSALIGRIVARLCLQLVKEYKIPLTNVEFVGFSLGGQVSGFFAKEIFEKTGQKIGKITALDCAAPLFETHGIYPSKEHVHFLEAVHTASGNILWRGKVGIGLDYGHVDYYPNGGIDQPGCKFLDLACAHNRAHDYYIEALSNSNECLYWGFPCDTVEAANKGSCHPVLDKSHFISQDNSTAEHGIFYLRTTGALPFCMADYNL